MQKIKYFMSDGEGTEALSEFLRHTMYGYWPMDGHKFSTNFSTLYVLGSYRAQKAWLE